MYSNFLKFDLHLAGKVKNKGLQAELQVTLSDLQQYP